MAAGAYHQQHMTRGWNGIDLAVGRQAMILWFIQVPTATITTGT
jgi:hypothetical protein